jgi:outer membrane lipoprotein-sorting protein
MQMEITYSDYRLAGGITVPFRMEIWRNGVNWTTIAIEQVQSNVGLSEAEFSIR